MQAGTYFFACFIKFHNVLPTQNNTSLVVTFCVKKNADIIAWALSKKHQLILHQFNWGVPIEQWERWVI